MREATIYFKDEEAGTLSQLNDGSFEFRYADLWFTDTEKPFISPTLPKSRQTHRSPFLFSFFFNMLPEGVNKELICRISRIDPDDHFGLLTASAQHDAIGAVRVEKIQ